MAKVLLYGFGEAAIVGLEHIRAAGEEIIGVVTTRPDPHEEIRHRSLEVAAARHNIPVFPDAHKLSGWGPPAGADIVVSLFYRRMIPMHIINAAPRGGVNFHASLLPKYRGRCPINWALIEGAKETGVTMHCMTERADAGDIIGQEQWPIAEDATAWTLFQRAVAGVQVLLEKHWYSVCAGTARRTPQDEAAATYRSSRVPEMGRVDPAHMTAETIDRYVRALTHPYPGAFIRIGDKKLMLWETEVR